MSVTERAPGVHVFDLGQNMVGWVRLAVRGERGAAVTLRFAEMLEPDGTLHLANLRSARPQETYVLRGGGDVEVFEPRFTFHGFRYVEVTGLPEPPTLETITGLVVHSDTPWTGRFECSSELVNQLWRNVTWGQRGNFLSVPTDCPQRDERLGWLADAQVFLPSAALNMDVAAFITKWGDDILDAQSAEGAYPDVAPRLAAERDGAPAWADAGVIVPWVIHERYGDVRIIERHWDAMERYVAYVVRHNPDLLWRHRRNNDYGDWLSVGADTPREVLGTAYLAYDAKLMARMARAIGGWTARRTTRSCTPTSPPPSTAPTSARTPSSKGTRRPCTSWRCTWTCSRSTSVRARRSASSPTSSATTGISRRASSASGCCARC